MSSSVPKMSFETTTHFFFFYGKFSQKSEKCGKNIRKIACFVVKEGLKSDKISEKKCFFLIFSKSQKHPKSNTPKKNMHLRNIMHRKLKIVRFSPIFLNDVEKYVNKSL